MKANIHRVPAGKGPFHGCSLRLTIGIIVKNGEKTLEKCLESVQPLLNAVPSELIVTDTGSTDGTLEIAKRHTDHIIRFEWNGDFSAARNTGLNAAQGEWFLFLDADEWFEDVSELISFFSGTECDRYGSGSYIQRNYMDFEGKTYNDFHATRMFRRYPGIRFEHSIHEAVRWLKPLRFFNAYVHHYGYVFRSPEEKKAKVRRNLGMLEAALEKDPNDLKLLYQIARQYFSVKEYDKIIESCRRGLAEEKKHPQREWKLSFYSVLVKAYYESGKYREAIDAVRECEANDKGAELPYVDYYLFETLSHFYLKEYGEAVCAGEKYGEAFDRYRSGKLNNEYLLYGNDIGIQPIQHENVAVTVVRSRIAQDQYEEAAKAFARIDCSVADVVGQGISVLCFLLAEKTGNYASVPAYYARILATEDLGKKQNFIEICEAYIRQNPDHRDDVVRAFAASDCADNYAVTNRMRAAGTDDCAAIQRLMGMLTPDAMGWDAACADALYLPMQCGADLSPLFDVVDRDSLPALILGAEREHPDAAEVFYTYFSRRSFSDRRGLYWRVCFEERVLLRYKNFSAREQLAYLRRFVADLNEYGRTIYRNELFAPEELSQLPRIIRFGWHMQRAFALQPGGSADYVHELREALRSMPAMQEPIQRLLRAFEDDFERSRQRSEEFQGLAARVKAQITNLIECGRLEEAGRITESLAKLVPDDADVRRFRERTHTEPSMREIAAQLPQ